MEQKLYFAYGSNLNLEQMAYRCPAASVVGKAVLKDYRLVFRGNTRGNGVASILPEEGREVTGLLWRITENCEKSLDLYEGYPKLYVKREITVQSEDGRTAKAEVYIMNEPYQSCPTMPGSFYLQGILDGCRQNHLPVSSVKQAVNETRKEIKNQRSEQKDRENVR